MEAFLRNRILGLALSAPLLAGFVFTSSIASEGHDSESCGGPAAVTTLPAPLNKWASVICTQAGYVITGREGWVWVEPTNKALVVIPSQSLGNEGNFGDSAAYFTKIELTKVSGDEFEKAYETFHAGFDPKDAKPTGYRLDVTTMAGKDIRVYMFDYFTYGWGMACSKEACDPASRFVMLNMKEDPKPLAAPI